VCEPKGTRAAMPVLPSRDVLAGDRRVIGMTAQPVGELRLRPTVRATEVVDQRTDSDTIAHVRAPLGPRPQMSLAARGAIHGQVTARPRPRIKIYCGDPTQPGAPVATRAAQPIRTARAPYRPRRRHHCAPSSPALRGRPGGVILRADAHRPDARLATALIVISGPLTSTSRFACWLVRTTTTARQRPAQLALRVSARPSLGRRDVAPRQTVSARRARELVQ